MSRKVYILRGVPGCGKSHWIATNALRLGLDASAVCSADRFFEYETAGGVVEYRWDPLRIQEAHADCRRRFIRLLEQKRPVIVVDNTNIRRWEFADYVAAARLRDYEVEEVNLMPTTIAELRECAKRNVHGVPAGVIGKLAMEFEE